MKHTAKKSKTSVVKKLFYPHPGNNHHPHAIRHKSLAVYALLLLTFNIGYNVFVAHSSKVLGFASSISQQALIQMTNQQRSANGIGTVTENKLLDQAAMQKAQNMFQEDYWAHFAPSGKSPWYWFDLQGYAYTLAGENLARDFDTSQGVIDGWMNSPSHRANMLAPGYKEIGIAVLNGTLQGQQTTLVVQHFGTPVVLAAANSAPYIPPTVSTIKPQNAPAPTAIPIQEQQLAQETQLPKQAGAVGIPSISPSVLAAIPYQLLHPKSIFTWSLQQIVTTTFLLILMILFLFDSGVIHRQGIKRQHSHSFLHAGMMGVMILVIAYSAIGGVL